MNGPKKIIITQKSTIDQDENLGAKKVFVKKRDDNLSNNTKPHQVVVKKINQAVEKKEDRLDKNNNPFNSLLEVKKVKDKNQTQSEYLDTKRELISELGEKGRKKTQTAQEIFHRLNGISYKKNQENNQYLIDFKKWLLEEIKGKRGKAQIWEDLRRVYNTFTVHGQKTQTGLNKRADIDAAASILLLELAGFTDDGYRNLNVVDNGESGPGINLDTGGSGGIKIEGYEKNRTTIKDDKIRREKSLFGTKLLIDEHGGGPCSTTRMIYQILRDFDKIADDQKDQIKRFVEFVDIVDDLGYKASGLISPFMERTIFGLYKFLPIGFVFNYFKDPNKTGFEYLHDKYLIENKVSILDMESKQKIEKPLKEISDNKKDRMNKAYKSLVKLESEGYFLMLGNDRFIVDLGGKLIDGPETASIYEKGIIRLFPGTGDLYIYSPFKLPNNLGGLEVINDRFVIDKIGSGKDLNKLLNEFDYLPQKVYSTSTEIGSKLDLKKEIINYRKEVEEKRFELERERELAKQHKTEVRESLLKNIFSDLPDLAIDEIEIGKSYNGIVNNTQGNIVFVTFDRNNKIRGVLHKNDVENIETFKSIVPGDVLSVKIKEIEKNGETSKIKLIFNSIVKSSELEINVA